MRHVNKSRSWVLLENLSRLQAGLGSYLVQLLKSHFEPELNNNLTNEL